jgi:hypothetical protein
MARRRVCLCAAIAQAGGFAMAGLQVRRVYTSRAFSAREREVAPGLLALVRSGEGLLGMR